MNVLKFAGILQMRRTWWVAACVVVAASVLAWAATGISAPQEEKSPAPNQKSTAVKPQEAAAPPTSIDTGSGKQFKTTVDRKTEGELSPEDFRQASLLTSRIVMHLNDAASNLLDERVGEARKELEQAVALVGVVRKLLPTTTVTTVVHDADGKEVYRDVDRVQEDRIPLFEELIAVNILEPITEAKEDAAELAGVRLADADLLHTSVLVELDYVERKLNRALKLLEKEDGAEEAVAQLLLAQSHGVSFDVNKEDNPLVNAQMALQLAERMVEQGREEAAKANLQLAKNHLELYRGLLAKGETEHVRKLQGEITKLQGAIASKDAAETIRGFWDRVTSWFAQAPGETRATATEAKDPQPGSKDTPESVASQGKGHEEERR